MSAAGKQPKARTAKTRKPRLRLIEVKVQPVFVLDHGDNLEPLDHPVVSVPGSEWGTYSGERFPAEVAAWQAKLDSDDEPEA